MSKFTLTFAALFALAMIGFTAESADAQGLHFGGGGIHVDVGNPHGGYHSTYYPSWGGGCHTPGYGWGGGHSWHNTSHYDWHPTEYNWHGNHWDVQPGHWDYHQTGHWDHHHP